MRKLLAVGSLLLFLLGMSGCRQSYEPALSGPAIELVFKGLHNRPITRIGSYPCPTLGTTYLEPDGLGEHRYGFDLLEKDGIVYTCRAGHIDIFHVRESADWTAFLAGRIYPQLMKNRTEFSFRLKEGSIGHIALDYPHGWKDMPKQQKKETVHDISIRLGQYLAYSAMTWHEILTWFGYKSTGILPEFPSSFSWEDSYSNLLGCDVAGIALRDGKHTYCEAITIAINRELAELGVQPARVGHRAAEMVRGWWFSGELPFIVDIRARNFDIGLNNGLVTPWIIPLAGDCEGVGARPLPAPNTDFLAKYRFSARFEIEPKEWEKDTILGIVYAKGQKRHNRLEPAVHYALIMDYIQADAAKKYGKDTAFSRLH